MRHFIHQLPTASVQTACLVAAMGPKSQSLPARSTASRMAAVPAACYRSSILNCSMLNRTTSMSGEAGSADRLADLAGSTELAGPQQRTSFAVAFPGCSWSRWGLAADAPSALPASPAPRKQASSKSEMRPVAAPSPRAAAVRHSDAGC